MKKLDAALLIGLVVSIIISSVSAFAKDLDGISDNVLRLHILANSDSEEDQALKLKVRDAILAETSELFAECNSRLEVEQVALDNMDRIQAIAEKVIKENGYDYPVKCEITYMKFDDRTYDDLTLPGGYYDAVRITIGEAKGHNWWCVMYPQFCIAPSIDKKSLDILENTKFLNYSESSSKKEKLENFNKREVKIMKEPKKYKFKFYGVELYRKVKKAFS